MLDCSRRVCHRLLLMMSVIVWTLGAESGIVAQQPDQAEMLLSAARKAALEKNYAQASERYREFIQRFGNHPQAASARYGLALALLELPNRDFNAIVNTLEPVAGATNAPEYPYILYTLAVGYRGQGNAFLDQMLGKTGGERDQLRDKANDRFNNAARLFADALKAFTARANDAPQDAPKDEKAEPLPELWQWLARCRVDLAEMELRLGRTKEALATSEPFVQDARLKRAEVAPLGLYFHGYAAFLRNELPLAARSLNQNAVITHPVVGSHAQFLLGRVFQQAEDWPAAAARFEAVLELYAKQKQQATEALKQPDRLPADERARLERLVRGPAPDHVTQANYFLACLQYQTGRYAEALARFGEFAKANPQHPRAVEATLQIGYCQVQLKQYKEALQTLQPLVAQQPKLADQALLWIGRAQANLFDPEKAAERENALKTAINTLRQAADRANQLANQDPQARQRRADILLELADTLSAAKQYQQAADTYQTLLNEKLLPQRAEEITQRLIAAVHLAGDYNRSDELCNAFLKDYPKSTLAPAVLFRRAENAYFQALNNAKRPDLPKEELQKQFAEAGKRYAAIIERYPEFEQINLARYGLALTHLKRQEYEAALSVLEKIGPAERVGELAMASFLHAECLLRLAPRDADDALAAGKLQEALATAAQQLEAFLAAMPKAAEAPAALLKLGLCQQRTAALLAQPQARSDAISAARRTYERLLQEFGKHPLAPQAIYERARCLAFAGDKGGAINELRRFSQDPLKDTAVAPMALIQLATYLREQNRAEEAASTLAAFRQQSEPSLAKDPERAKLIPMLKYHQGIALQEVKKFDEAVKLFQEVMQLAPNSAVALEANLRSGQCRISQLRGEFESALRKINETKADSNEHKDATRRLDEAATKLQSVGDALVKAADAAKPAHPDNPARARLFYEAAWAYRTLADYQLAKKREEIARDRQRKLQEEVNKNTPPGLKPLSVPLPQVPLKEVPILTIEEKTRGAYYGLVNEFPELPLAVEARFELAELHQQRDEHAVAIALLKEALDKEPPAERAILLQLRLGEAYLAKGDVPAALGVFEAVVADPKRPLEVLAQGYYRAGECLLAMGENTKAVNRLAIFRDNGQYHHISGVSDRALLRLGLAFARLKQWEASRATYQTLADRFSQSLVVHEARYGAAFALQNLGRFDEAVNLYNQVINATNTEAAAKSLLQIGLCRSAQKRYPEAIAALSRVPDLYDYPELSAAARYELARNYAESGDVNTARRYYQLVIDRHPESPWAQTARERLEKLK